MRVNYLQYVKNIYEINFIPSLNRLFFNIIETNFVFLRLSFWMRKNIK